MTCLDIMPLIILIFFSGEKTNLKNIFSTISLANFHNAIRFWTDSLAHKIGLTSLETDREKSGTERNRH